MTERETSEQGKHSCAVVRALIEAAFGGDQAGATRWCTPDLVLRIEGTQEVYGHEGLRQLMNFTDEFTSDVRVEIHRVIGSGNTAAVERTTFLTIGGEPVALEVGAFFTLRDGLVAQWTDYQDMRDVGRALGH